MVLEQEKAIQPIGIGKGPQGDLTVAISGVPTHYFHDQTCLVPPSPPCSLSSSAIHVWRICARTFFLIPSGVPSEGEGSAVGAAEEKTFQKEN